MQDSSQEYPDVTRVEMIDDTGRVYTAYNATDVIVLLQDNGRTLKIMHRGNANSLPTGEHATSFGEALNELLKDLTPEKLFELGILSSVDLANIDYTDYDEPSQEGKRKQHEVTNKEPDEDEK